MIRGCPRRLILFPIFSLLRIFYHQFVPWFHWTMVSMRPPTICLEWKKKLILELEKFINLDAIKKSRELLWRYWLVVKIYLCPSVYTLEICTYFETLPQLNTFFIRKSKQKYHTIIFPSTSLTLIFGRHYLNFIEHVNELLLRHVFHPLQMLKISWPLFSKLIFHEVQAVLNGI